MIRCNFSTEDSRLSVRVPEEQLKSVSEVGIYGENAFYVILNDKWMWMGTFDPELLFISSSEDITFSTTKLPNTRYILGVVADAEEKTFVYCSRDCDMLNINIYSVESNYSIIPTHTFTTPMTCSGSGMTGTFSSPKVNEYSLIWGDISNDSFFYTFSVKRLSVTPIYTSSTLKRVECEDAHACLRFRTMEVIYPGADESVYHCQVRGVGRDAPDRLSVIIYHAALIGSERAQVVFSSIVQLPFDMYFADMKNRPISELEYFGCEAIIEKIQLTPSGALVGLLRIHVCKYVPLVHDADIGEHECSATTSKRSTEKVKEYHDQAVYLLVSLQQNTVLDMHVSNAWCSSCTIDFTGQYIVRVVADSE